MKQILCFFVFYLACHAALAQTAATNTGILYVTGNSDILYAGSDFSNTASASLSNNGNLYIRGNLANAQSAMAPGSGTLYLNGTSAQSVNGTQPFHTYHLNSNNISGITLNNNLRVSGLHTFSSGLIQTSATPNYIVYEAGASYTGSSDARHVNGWVKKIGSTDFVFPVGDATYERPVTMSGLSSNSEFNARYSTSTPNTAYNYMQLPLVMVNPNEYWFVNQVSGGTAQITLNWDHSKVHFRNWIIPDLRVASFNGSMWVNRGGSATGTAFTTGTITSDAISSFTIFTIGSISYVLPVTLTGFEALRLNRTTLVRWAAEKEENITAYSVERSDEGSRFYPIGQVTARNGTGRENYTYSDLTPVINKAWYRLRSLNRDGKEAFSRIAVVSEGTGNRLPLVSNPVRSEIQLQAMGGINGWFAYSLSNMAGQKVQEGRTNIQSGTMHRIALHRRLPTGSYILSIYNNAENFSYKLVVE